MIDKFVIYRVIFPVRSRLQRRLREERLSADANEFAQGLSPDGRQAEVACLLWEMLREHAFVADFRPDPNDDLAKVYALGPEEVRDDIVDPLLDRLGLSFSGMDFTGFDFASITTPKDISAFVAKVAEGQFKHSAR